MQTVNLQLSLLMSLLSTGSHTGFHENCLMNTVVSLPTHENTEYDAKTCTKE